MCLSHTPAFFLDAFIFSRHPGEPAVRADDSRDVGFDSSDVGVDSSGVGVSGVTFSFSLCSWRLAAMKSGS